MNTEQVIFYAVIAIAFVTLVVYACITLNQLTRVLKDVEKTVERLNTIADKVDGMVTNAANISGNVSGLLTGISGILSNMVRGSVAKKAAAKIRQQ